MGVMGGSPSARDEATSERKTKTDERRDTETRKHGRRARYAFRVSVFPCLSSFKLTLRPLLAAVAALASAPTARASAPAVPPSAARAALRGRARARRAGSRGAP